MHGRFAFKLPNFLSLPEVFVIRRVLAGLCSLWQRKVTAKLKNIHEHVRVNTVRKRRPPEVRVVTLTGTLFLK